LEWLFQHVLAFTFTQMVILPALALKSLEYNKKTLQGKSGETLHSDY